VSGFTNLRARRGGGPFKAVVTAENGVRRVTSTKTALAAWRAARGFIWYGKLEGAEMVGTARRGRPGPPSGLFGQCTCTFWCDDRQLSAAELQRVNDLERERFDERSLSDQEHVRKLDRDLGRLRVESTPTLDLGGD
jgi:hypothetical protein